MYGIIRILLLTAAALTAAHPHPHNHPHYHHHSGECMEMRSSIRGSRTHWLSQQFKCMKGIKSPKEEVIATKICSTKARRYMLDFFKGDKINNFKDNSLDDVKAKKEEFFARCMVDRLDLKAKDGSLDTGKIIKNAVKMDSPDISALMTIQTWFTICTMNSTGINATEQYMDMRACIRRMVKDHCHQHQGLVRAYLQRGDEESVCVNVSTMAGASEIEQQFKICMAESALQAAKDNKGGPPGSAGTASGNQGGFAQTMVAACTCAAKKMNWYSEETGFDAEAYGDYLANFTGWEEIPEVLDDMITAIDSCESQFTGDLDTQIHQWKFCLKPKIVKICGFNNNVTTFLFPFIDADIQKAVMEYLEEMADMDDDNVEDENDEYDDDYYYDHDADYYDDDHNGDDFYEDYDKDDDKKENNNDDVEMVDDGLLESEPIKNVKEGNEDAILMYDADDDKNDDDDYDDLDKTKSLEDDAEDMMEQMKDKKGSKESTEDMADKSSNKSKNSKESKSESKDSGESAETTEVTDNIPDGTTEESVFP